MSYAEKLTFYLALTPEACLSPIKPLQDFADWLDSEAAQEAMAKPAPQSHSCPMPSQEGDEYVCRHPNCGRRWDVREEKPPCPLR